MKKSENGYNVLSKRARNIQDASAPFKVIDMPGGRSIRLYWTPRAGMYGHQVLAVWYENNSLAGEYITGGCGYCKEGAATWYALRALQARPRGGCRDNELNYKYHVGGNYYRITKKDLMKYPSSEKYQTTTKKIDRENGRNK
jgi:hypothetical protein